MHITQAQHMGTANLIMLIFLGRLKSLKRQTDISARVDTDRKL